MNPGDKITITLSATNRAVFNVGIHQAIDSTPLKIIHLLKLWEYLQFLQISSQVCTYDINIEWVISGVTHNTIANSVYAILLHPDYDMKTKNFIKTCELKVKFSSAATTAQTISIFSPGSSTLNYQIQKNS